MSQAAPDLGPFRAPSTLEPEFHAPTPRPIPDELKKGAYEQKRRGTVLGLLIGITAVPSILPVAFPEKVDPRWAFPAGIAVVALTGTVAVLLMKRSEDRKAKQVAAANARARREGRPIDMHVSLLARTGDQIVIGLLCGAVALFVVASGVACVNALRDPGPPSYEAVSVQQLQQETWTGLFRSYAVRYVRDDGAQDKIAVPVDRIADFQEAAAQRGALEHRPGYLGMPWVKDIHPVIAGKDGVSQVGLLDGSLVPLSR